MQESHQLAKRPVVRHLLSHPWTDVDASRAKTSDWFCSFPALQSAAGHTDTQGQRPHLVTRRHLLGAAQGETSNGTHVAGPTLRADRCAPNRMLSPQLCAGPGEGGGEGRGSRLVEVQPSVSSMPPGRTAELQGGQGGGHRHPGGCGPLWLSLPSPWLGGGFSSHCVDRWSRLGRARPTWFQSPFPVGDQSSQHFPSVSSHSFK